MTKSLFAALTTYGVMVSEYSLEYRLVSLSGFSEQPPAKPELKPMRSNKSLQLAQAFCIRPLTN